jgi:hypothetical protein
MKYLLALFSLCNMLVANAVITTPAQFLPADNSTFTAFRTSIAARTVTNATGYQFQVDTINSFQSASLTQYTAVPSNPPPIQTTITVSIYQLRLSQSYFWRVRAYSPGDTSAWSSTWKFTNIQGQLGLNSPTNNSTGPIRNLVSFNMSIDTAIGRYLFEADTNASFSSPLRVLKSIQTSSFQDSNLFNFNRTIYWRARSTNGLGDTLLWSPIWKYTTHTGPVINISNQINLVDPEYIVNWNTGGLSTTQVQADTISNFSSPYLKSSIAVSGAFRDTLRNLLFEQLYYLRIRGIYGDDTSAWSPLGLIQPRIGTITNPSFNGATIGAVTNITFAWSSSNGTKAMVKLYADSALNNLLVDTITNLTNYTYRDTMQLRKWYQLHITYFHQQDTATTRISNFRIFDGQLTLSSPQANAQKLPIRQNFEFRGYPWATGYLLQIDTGISFSQNRSPYFQQFTVFDTVGIIKNLSATALLAYNKKYVWRVYPIFKKDTGAANTRTFTTASEPVLHFPPNGFIGIGTETNGLIQSIVGSSYVQWQLDTTPFFNSTLLTLATDTALKDEFDTNYVPVNLPKHQLFHTKYFWRCRNISSIDTSMWSAAFSYVTTTDVTLVKPLNNAINVPIKVPLDWSIQGSNLSQRFQYQIGTDSLFTTTPIVTLAINEFSEDTFLANYATTYYWRARAYNDIDTSKWSVRYTFNTINIPAISNVTLLAPANNAINVSPELITFNWNGAVNATSYQIQVSTDIDFNNVVASSNQANPGSQWASALPRTKYFWRVRGISSLSDGPWSTRSFTTTSSTSLNEKSAEKTHISVYPNPTTHEINMMLSIPTRIQIYNQLGQKVWESAELINEAKITIDEWPKGIYIIKGQQNNDQIGATILLVQ